MVTELRNATSVPVVFFPLRKPFRLPDRQSDK